MDKMNSDGLNLLNKNVDKIKELFPECVSDGKIDFNQLRILLGDALENDNETYSFNWIGKNESIKFSQQSSRGTLLSCMDKSLNWDKTQNLFIEGDNLEVLKIINKSYHNKIKLVYIDPPYNTGKDFVYHDNYRDNLKHYLDLSNQNLKANPDTAGRFHTDWLNMIYPRIKLAEELLSDDGFCFIHIDEHEDYNLRKICNLIFGENNELGVIIWDKRNPKGDTVGVAYKHESILVYCKNKDSIKNTDFTRKKDNANEILSKAKDIIDKYGSVNDFSRNEFKKWMSENKDRFSGGEAAYNLIDDDGRVFQAVSMAAPDKPETRSHRPLIHPITKKPCPVPEKGWRFTDETMDEMLKNNQISFGVDENTQPRNKYYLVDNLSEMVPSLLYYGGSDNALGMPFDNPKPIYVCKKIISSVCKKDGDIVLDFFAGSSTSAHATLELNSEDGIKRKFIMVQIPEDFDYNLKNSKGADKSIIEKAIKMCDELGEKHKLTVLSEERIRRASKIIYNELKEKQASAGMLKDVIDPDSLDLGFKVFRLESSNIKEWDSSAKLDDDTIFAQQETIKEGRSNLDVAYEIMLKYGVFNMPLEEIIINNKTMFNVGKGFLIIDLNDNITQEDVESIGKEKPHCVVFKESGFGINDNVKLNAVKTLETFGVEDIKCL